MENKSRRADGQPRKILVVDDAVDVRKILRYHLETKGYTVLEASDGLEGLNVFNQEKPDLMILDIDMPVANGLQVYGGLTDKSGRTKLPIIILTTREELKNIFADLNVDGFINKPFNIDEVLNEIDTVMEKRYGSGKAAVHKESGSLVKILVIEDNKEMIGKLLPALTGNGFSVSWVSGGMDAIEKLMADIPDVILIKLELPDISGDLVVAKLKNMPRTMDIPCVLYTPNEGLIDIERTNKILENTKSDLLETSDPSVLIRKVKEVLGK